MAAEDLGKAASAARGNAHWFLGDLVIVHVSGEETDGRFCLIEFRQPPGEWTPLHVHRESDQTMYVLEGELTLHLPGGRTVVAGPGACAHGPVGLPHTEHVTSPEPLRLVEVNSPAGFEKFVAAVGEPAPQLTLPPPDWPPPDLERLTALAAEHAIDVLGPPGELP